MTTGTVKVQHKDVLGQDISPEDIVLHITESPVPRIVTKVTEHKVVLNGNSAVSPSNCVVITSNMCNVGKSSEVDALRKKYEDKIDHTTDLKVAGKPLRFVVRGYGNGQTYGTKIEQVVIIEMRGTNRTDFQLWVDPIDRDMKQTLGLNPVRLMHKAPFEKRHPPRNGSQQVPTPEASWSVYMWSVSEYMITQQRLVDVGLLATEIGKPFSASEWNNMMSAHPDLQVRT